MRFAHGHFRMSTLLLCCLLASGAASAACDFSAAAASVQTMLAADGLSDAALLIGSPRGILFKQFYGDNYSDATVIPLASATKLLSGVRIMQLVDRGALALDAPVSTYLPAPGYAWNSDNASITLRQMFSHTAGYGDDDDDPLLAFQNITLQTTVADIASNHLNLSPQNYLPAGSQFAYGGVAMEIGGQVAQAQTGQDWEISWKSDVGAPMCISTIDWQGLGATQNYRIAGGGESSLGDYARVLAMLAAGGVGNGRRILSQGAIAIMNHSQTGNATLGYAPPAADGSTQYGIGEWIEPSGVSVGAPTISSIGKFGFAPWVDFSNGSFGIIMVNGQNVPVNISPSTNSHVALTAIVAAVREQLSANGGTCPVVAIYDNIFADSMEMFAAAPVCPGVL
jgi:CubicO group peptidase (beta-lactamase class C family)